MPYHLFAQDELIPWYVRSGLVHWLFRPFDALRDLLEPGSRPYYRDHGTARGRRPVGKLEPRARAFQQRLGNEEAEAHADMLVELLRVPAMARAGGDERLAELFEHAWREAFAVVGDLDPDFGIGPIRHDVDLARGEIDGILH